MAYALAMNEELIQVSVDPPHVEPEPTRDEAEGLVIGIVALTVVAGLLEVVQRLRGGASWPVPMIIYGTLLPIVTFVIVMAWVKEAHLHPGYLIAAWAPLPFILTALFLGRGRGREGAGAADAA